jgi:hypothetical protein
MGQLNSSATLATKVEVEGVTLNLANYPTGIRLGLDVHHVKNEETKRAFHASIEIEIPWTIVQRLRAQFEMWLATRDD